MARVAIPITWLDEFQTGADLTGEVGNSSLDMTISLANSPRLILFLAHRSTGTLVFTVELVAGKSSYNETISVAGLVEGLGGGPDNVVAIPLDIPKDLWQANSQLHIDSESPIYSAGTFYAVAWGRPKHRR